MWTRILRVVGGIIAIAGAVGLLMWVSTPRGSITFDPPAYRCDQPRTYTMTLDRVLDPQEWVTIEVYREGRLGVAMTHHAERVFGAPIEGTTYQLYAEEPGGLDCDLGPGTFRWVVRAGEHGPILAETTFTILE